MEPLLELFGVRLTLFQRIMILWAFVLVGLVIAVQISQTAEKQPLVWTRLTSETK
jgi:hypothetical protein